jgi:guanylate kinase
MHSQTTNTPSLVVLISLAREKRRGPTKSEALLWAQLRGRKLGVRFRRQHPFAIGYIVDFFAPAVRVVVEVDGGVHLGEEHARRDAWRQREIEETYGVRFVRVSAGLVERDVLRAVEIVRAAMT